MRNLQEMNLTELNTKLDALATAKEVPVFYRENIKGKEVLLKADEYKGIVNCRSEDLEAIASKGYTLIQHKEVFGAIVGAMEEAKPDAKVLASVLEHKGRAWMSVVFQDVVADDGDGGINFGILSSSSFDKSSAIRYSGSSKDNSEGRFEFFAIRKKDNGTMIFRVPLSGLKEYKVDNGTLQGSTSYIGVGKAHDMQLENPDTAKDGEQIGIRKQKVIAENQVRGYIRHYGAGAAIQVNRVRSMLLALPEVAKYVEDKIAAAKDVAMDEVAASTMLTKLKFGPRSSEKILEYFREGEQTSFGLWSSMNLYATKDEKVSLRRMEEILKSAEAVITM